jgi:cyclophilin family peptidyl-prolyl cis-trans isomerase
MHAATLLSVLFSVLMPAKMWFAPSQPINVTIQADKQVILYATDFTGKKLDAKNNTVAPGAVANVTTIFPAVGTPGTYILYALPDGSTIPDSGAPKNFVGTPLLIEALPDRNSQAPAVDVTHVLPLQYAVMTTDAGPISAMFYYDVAPNTVNNFLGLASEGYYDGLVFHRVVPGFVIQGGDPLGADADPNRRGTGGPGYTINAEFNDHPHLEGVLSMARATDPNSAGSQFFVCLDYAQTKQLDQQYTAFGRVFDGMDAVKKIGGSKIVDDQRGAPETPTVIQHVDVLPVTPDHDPYPPAPVTANP